MHKLHNVNVVDREDGLQLADLAIKQTDRKPLSEYVSVSLKIPGLYALILLRYLDLAKQHVESTAFAVAFVTRLMRDTKSEQDYRVSDNLNVFLELFTGLLPTFFVECRSVAKRARSESDTPLNPVQCLLNADDVAALLMQLDRQDLQGWGLQLTSKLQAEAGTVDVIAFESFFIPLLSALITIVPWISERVTRYRNLFRTTLQMLAKRFVQIAPQPGKWTYNPRGCGCRNCRQLDQFLISSSQQSIRFPVSSSERAHLHQMLNGTNIRHVTERWGVETLVVTKPATPSLVKHEQWVARFAKAREWILKLDQDVLKQLLDDDYGYLIELEDTRREREGLPSARGAVRRRGPEIIDLT